MSEYIRKVRGCSPDAVGNMPCDNGFPCDACMHVPASNSDSDDEYFSPYEYYKDKQCKDIHLPGYSEGLALHTLLQRLDLALDEANDEGWIDNDIYPQVTITVDGVATAFILGGPQYDALITFIKQVASENLHYVDPKLKYVKGFL